MSKSRLAVSIVLIYKEEVFSITRKKYLKAFPGYTAFPGGKVEKQDQVEGNLAKTLYNALCREAMEELGLDINKMSLAREINCIEQIAHAKSPSFNPYIYDTYFYRIEFKNKPELKLDRNEMENALWSKPSVVVNDYNQGKRILIYPILKVLQELSLNTKRVKFLDYSQRENQIESIPFVEPMKDFLQFMPKSNTLPPASRTNAFIIGDDKKCLIDPSAQNIEEFEKLKIALSHFEIDKIIITHHHGDHHEYAANMAKHLDVDIYISEDSYLRCKKKYGEEYFGDAQVVFLEENMVVSKWLGKDVIGLAVPGHDEGQFAFMPMCKSWCIVGDLFQGIGTVVVGGEEGDMQKYFASLKKIIDLNPEAVVPSHGIMLGGVNIIKKTLRHREHRESQVLELSKAGKNIDEILSTIYFDLPEKLIPYARANIESHIVKLKNQGDLL
jgi:glyoxylase-like metal-dependent hydrolase (beta-lactamase superfamily II)/8-oxo-dGTP pyrophosphatase MutT (NUDIX family)